MTTDPLDVCRARWRDAPPLTDDELRQRLDHHAADATHSRLVAEILRLREAEVVNTKMLRRVTLKAAMWREAYYADVQWGRELWLACWMVAMQAALSNPTMDDSGRVPRSTGRRR